MAGRRGRRGLGSDRISNLPHDILGRILIHLPVRDAVRTSILSKQWRHSWLSIPHLVFNDEYCGCTTAVMVYHVLMRHRGPILKFWFEKKNFRYLDSIDDWLHFLLNHSSVEDFKLNLYQYSGYYVIPQCLFSFEHLRNLHLEGVQINLPPAFNGFSRLVALTLWNVPDLLPILNSFISTCPMLEFLSIQLAEEMELLSLNFADSKLETLRLSGSFTSIYLNCPSIKEFALDFEQFIWWKGNPLLDDFEVLNSQGSKSNLVKVFCQIPSIERVHLFSYGLLQFLAVGGVPQELPDKLNHLIQLDIDDISLRSDESIRIVVCLIRSSPNLKCLQIKSRTVKANFGTIQYLKSQQECNVQLPCLERVKITHMFFCEDQMEIVKLLLLWAPVLAKMEIKCKHSTEKPSKVLRKLNKLRRASPEAELIFQGGVNHFKRGNAKF